MKSSMCPGRSLKRIFLSLFVLQIILILSYILVLKTEEEKGESYKYVLNLKKAAQKLRDAGTVVNTSQCRIPDFDPMDEEVVPLLRRPVEPEICGSYKHWSHMEDETLVLSTEQMKKDGCPFSPRLCCYKILRRDPPLTPDEDGYTDKEVRLGDRKISYSHCIPLDSPRHKLQTQFVMVECSCSKLSLGRVSYRGFHHVVTHKDNSRRKEIMKKINFWGQKNGSSARPPNIVVLGFDTVSRLTFRRQMVQTTRLLERFGAVEMMGYTKVGEQTFPNYVPLFTGYSMWDYLKLCAVDKRIYQDACPLLWNQLDEANYLTAHTEDYVEYTGFHNWKSGFLKQPTDFYDRPAFLAALDYYLPWPIRFRRVNFANCFGYQTGDEAMLEYVQSSLKYSSVHQAPIFSFSWSAVRTHDNINGAGLLDRVYADFLLWLENEGYLENTVLVMLSDHGPRYGELRDTLVGSYEDKLPAMWIKLPSGRFPQQWHSTLKANAKRLSTPYHFYGTIITILRETTGIPFPPDAYLPVWPTLPSGPSHAVPRTIEEANIPLSNHPVRRPLLNQSFLNPIPENSSCKILQIPEQYCPCYLWDEVPPGNPKLLQVATEAILKINSNLTLEMGERKCAELKLNEIVGGTVTTLSDSNDKLYSVMFTAEPGTIEIQADVQDAHGQLTVLSVQRTNRINKKYTRCTKDVAVELFCYCL